MAVATLVLATALTGGIRVAVAQDIDGTVALIADEAAAQLDAGVASVSVALAAGLEMVGLWDTRIPASLEEVRAPAAPTSR